MYYRFVYLVFLLATGSISIAQTMPTGRPVWPDSGAKLNYTQVMFEHALVRGADEYEVDVALSDDSLFTHPVASSRDSSCASMIGGLEWGQKYIWRYIGLKKRQILSLTGPYAFEILTSRYTDGENYRVRVLANDDSANAGGLITIDKMRTIIDRRGRCVWYLPKDTLRENVKNNFDPSPLELRITAQGTITLISGGKAEEIDLNRNLLWQAPKRSAFGIDSFNIHHPYHYHHCFKKLANGNYMVLDMKNIARPNPASDNGRVMMAYEVIRELDRAGQLVWSWNSENYFSPAELQAMAMGRPDSTLINQEPGGHMNAFDVDEKNGFVYAGFRNVSRVVKIDKTSGRVVCAWGTNMKYNGAANGDSFFFKQHDAALLRDGSIAVFNNNAPLDNPDKPGHPKPGKIAAPRTTRSGVVIFSQPDEKANSRVIWKYEFAFDSGDNLSPRGGGVNEMKNGNLLVCMGTVNRIFEVTRDKKIVWSAVVEQWSAPDSLWQPMVLYRAHTASSLYPCYFTIQAGPDTVRAASSAFQLRIFNDGTEDDSYEVNIAFASGAYKKQFTTAVLRSKGSARFEIAPDKLPTGDDKIKISVRSKTNPGFKRARSIIYSSTAAK